MIRYESTPQQVLPTALAFLHDQYDALLCSGTSLAMFHDGTVSHTRSMRGSPGYGRGFYDRIRAGDSEIFETRVPRPQGSGPPHILDSLITTHLPYGLPVINRKAIGQFTVSFLPGDVATRDAPSSANSVSVPELFPGSITIFRNEIGRYDPVGFVEDIVDLIWEHENEFCLRALSGLPRHEGALEYENGAGLGDLLERACSMANPDPNSPVQLDTVFMPRELFSRSAPDDYYVNTVKVQSSAPGGLPMYGLGHRLIPENTLYIISSARGPTFIDGPTTITCTESKLVLHRYSSVVLPPASGSAVPLGFKIDIKAVS